MRERLRRGRGPPSVGRVDTIVDRVESGRGTTEKKEMPLFLARPALEFGLARNMHVAENPGLDPGTDPPASVGFSCGAILFRCLIVLLP